MALLEVERLCVDYRAPQGSVRVLDDLAFRLDAGRTLGLVGESGSGKSQTALAIMGLLPGSAQVSGAVRFEGRDLLSLKEEPRRQLRGTRVAMIFQDPMTSLNPYLTVGQQLSEMLTAHGRADRAQALAESARMLDAVRIPDAARRLRQYPHEFSGGMRQRVMIAMMLLLKPALLIADEPTTALDVTVQAQILRLLQELRCNFGLALLLISHDLGVIASIADEVLVLYGGRRMESAATSVLLHRSLHPYTRALIAARPRLDSPLGAPLLAIPGAPARAGAGRDACPFSPRCVQADASCKLHVPQWRIGADETGLACHQVK